MTNQIYNSDNITNLEYKVLSEHGNLGFYKSCEVTTIFLLDKLSKDVYNYFSLFVFEEREIETNKVKYLTDKLLTVSDEYRMGICKYQLSMDDVYNNFTQITNSEVLSNISGKLQIGQLDLVNKQFVPPDGTEEVNLNKCLKNNFINGSYIYEFFDIEKKLLSKLTKIQRERISEHIMKFAPINLHVLQDRIGNVIFQFPSNLISINSASNKDDTSLNITISTDKRIDEEDRYSILVMNEFDNCITGIKYHDSKNNKNVKLDIGDTGNLIKTVVYDKKTDLVVYESKYSLMKQMHFRFNIGSQFPQKRTIITSKEENEVVVESTEFMETPRNMIEKKKYWKEFVQERQYKERLEELERRMKFMQYGASQDFDKNKALEDIRKLIVLNSEKQIMLWDPYLSAEDILNTLYYSKQMGIPMRAITSSSSETRKINGENEQDAITWINEQKNILKNNSNNYGINLEVRCQYGQFGWKFHDRFLLFIMRDGTARVWSLGTSINSLGKNHHIIQEVSHPQYIVDAFDELWNKLNDKRCILWKSR